MASFGSSVINKSGKKFAPKARRRAGAAAASEQTSATSSADQTPASTPAAVESAQSDSHDVLPTPPATQAAAQSEHHDDKSTKPVNEAPAQSKRPATESEPPDAQPSAEIASAESTSSSTPESTPTQSHDTSDAAPSNTTSSTDRAVAVENAKTAALPPNIPDIASQLSGEYTEAVSDDSQRSPKRRKIGMPKMVGLGSLARSSAFGTGSTTPSRGPEQGILTTAPTPQPTAPSNNIFSPPDVTSLRDPASRSPVKEKALSQSKRGVPRVTNKELIQSILGPRSGATKPSIRSSATQQPPDENQESGPANSDTPNSDRSLNQSTSQSDAPGDSQPTLSEPPKVSKRGPNPAAAKRRGRKTTSQDDVETVEEQRCGTQAIQEVENSTSEATPAPLAKKPRKPRKDTGKAKRTEKSAEEESGNGAAAPVPRPKRQRKRPTVQVTRAEVNSNTEGNELTAGAWVQNENNADSGDLEPTWRFELKNHLVRDKEEPENPEKTRINAASMPMSVLTKDISEVGKLSHREEALSKIDWDEEKRKRIEERERIALGEEEINTQAEREEAMRKIQEAANEAESGSANPRMRVVNGRLVLDSGSTQVDRHARALEDESELQEIEENELTTRVNSMSWIKSNRKDPRERTTWGPIRADRWTDEMTDQFYEALKMFGTDFFIISKMFPGKTRANVKRKFVKEERLNPDRVKRALIGEVVPMNFETFKEKSGKGEEFFRDPEELRREMAEEEARQKVEIEEAAARHAEQMRQRALAEGQNGEGDADGGKKKKKRDKKKAQAPIGGDDIEVVALEGDELDYR
ncbi:uncharacterized protein J3D65DRAFT_661739 [Phyllosticta citribraziliensis]|uniref:Myb-like domain-containing protein n=1 Tax=Phyllosticta citribraziliensis TaxID=989973 RepID=A0ABR1L7Y3_9PEZI